MIWLPLLFPALWASQELLGMIRGTGGSRQGLRCGRGEKAPTGRQAGSVSLRLAGSQGTGALVW